LNNTERRIAKCTEAIRLRMCKASLGNLEVLH